MKLAFLKGPLFTHYWLPVIAWMMVIFLFSSQAHSGAITESFFGDWNVPIRKCAHLLEYFVLASLARRAFGQSGGVWASRKGIFALVLCAFYAFGDEWHQSYVPGRSASVADAFVDIVGALLAIALLALRARVTCQKQ
jgi:VanZ family protein